MAAPSNNPLLHRIAENPRVPSPPPVALRVLEKASSPSCTLPELGRIISSDPALCGKLLQIVNSALFTRSPRAVTSVDRALGLLGINRIRTLLLSLSLPAMSGRCRADHRLRNFWRASATTAIIARDLAARLGRPDPETDMVAGLLSDLGILVLRETFGAPYDGLLDQPAARLARSQCELEEQSWGVSHPEVGAFLLRRWHLPEEITEAVRYHHAPAAASRLAAPLAQRCQLLHFANRAAALQLAPDDLTLVREVIDLAKQSYGMGEQDLRAFLEPLGQKVDELAALLHVDAGASLDFGRVFDAATEQLTRLAYETSLDNLRIEGEKNRAEEGLREAERARERAEEQLRQAQKMEAIGRLAGGVAHDFNNVLTVINGYSDMLLRLLPPDFPFRPQIEQIRNAGERGAGLTGQLLAFSRKQVLNPIALDLNQVIANLDKMMRRLVGEDVRIVHAPGAGLYPVKADPGQVEQVLLNLLVNARDAMPEGGTITIETANVELGVGGAAVLGEVRPGEYVLLTVRDTGCGILPELLPQIFEPFFTTKEEGKGTGLGLSTVYGIVKQSNGHVAVESEVARGTTFKIYLPKAGASTISETQRRTQTPPPTGAETVLVAEDEGPLRHLLRLTLEGFGYTVLTAEDGQDALRVSAAHPGSIDVLLADVIMPHMGGPELAQKLAAERPGVKVLYMSGYTDDAVVRRGALREGTPFLQKPFSPHALACKVREALEIHRASG